MLCTRSSNGGADNVTSKSVTVRMDLDLYRFLRREMVETESANLSDLIRSILEDYRRQKLPKGD